MFAFLFWYVFREVL